MGKKSKVTVNIEPNDLFIDGVLDDNTKNRVLRSQLWPSAVAMHLLTDKQVKIGPVHSDGATTILHMMTDSGMSVAALTHTTNGNDYYKVLFADSPVMSSSLLDTSKYSQVLESNNAKYPVTAMSPGSRHQVKGVIKTKLAEANRFVQRMIVRRIDSVVDTLAGKRLSRPEMNINNEVATTMIRVLVGGEDKSKIKVQDWNNMESIYINYTKDCKEFENAVDRAAKFFSADKWVVVPDTLGGVVVGAIGNQPILKAYEEYKTDGSYPDSTSYSYVDVTVPFKWYPSMEHIPADIRKDLDISLMMFRAHTNSATNVPNIDRFKVWEPIEAFALYGYETGYAHVLVLNK